MENRDQINTPQLTVRKNYRKRHRLLSKLLWFEVPWILLLGPSILFTEYFWEPQYRLPFILYLFLFWPIRLLVQRLRLVPKLPVWPVYLIIIGTAMGVAVAGGVDRAWEGAGHILYGIVLMVALANWPPLRRQPRLLLLAVAAIALPLALIGPEQFSVNPRKLLDVYDAGSVTAPAATVWEERINPNIMAGALVPLMPLFVALALWSSWRRRPWLPLLSVVLTVVMGNAIILSQSRAGYLAVGGGLLLIMVLRWPRLLYGFPILLIGGIVAIFTAVIDRAGIGQLASQALESLENRILLWQIGLDMFQTSSLMGIGIGQYDLNLTAHYAEYLPTFFGSSPPHAHNQLLQIGLDTGIFGLLGYGILLGWIIYRLVRQLMRGRAARGWPESAGALGSVFAFLLIGLFDIVTWGTRLAFVPWILMAFIILVVNYDFDAMD